jgi:hypothetical protein
MVVVLVGSSDLLIPGLLHSGTGVVTAERHDRAPIVCSRFSASCRILEYPLYHSLLLASGEAERRAGVLVFLRRSTVEAVVVSAIFANATG